MNDFILIFIGIFILLLIILLFTLLAYVYNTYVSYTIEINKNLNDSEVSINSTNDAFNKLQDTVVNNIATVKTNQEKIIENNKDNLNIFDSNILKLLTINNNNNKLGSLISSNIDTTKPLNIDFNTELTTYKNIKSLTNSNQFVNICNNETDETKRKCINLNIDNDGIFNIYTKNQLINDNKSNLANISIRDNSNNILASFSGSDNTIQLGSNLNPAILIKNNIYTPDIIVCNYSYINNVVYIAPTSTTVGGITTVTNPGQEAQPAKIKITFISNFKISKNVFINFNILYNNIDTISNTVSVSGLSSITYKDNILKLKSSSDIEKNVIKIYEIPINFSVTPSNFSNTYNTNGYVTLD